MLGRFGRWLALASLTVLLGACGAKETPPPVVTVYGAGTPTAGLNLPTPVVVQSTAIAPTPTALTIAPTAIPVYGPGPFPENVNPLTGEVVDPAKLNRAPIAVKISNFPYSVRPQFGLSLADMVWEHSAEAGVTRFTAVFLQNDVAKAGSIRSARFIDTEIAPIHQALLVTSGSSAGTMQHLRESAWFAGANAWRLVSEESQYVCPPLCRERPDDTNTLFTSSDAVRASTEAKGSKQRSAVGGFMFTANVPSGGVPLTTVMVNFSLAAHVEWRYDAATGRYARWQEKDSTNEMAPHIDALTNQPISATNVALLFINHQNNYIPEDYRDGGNCGLEIQVWTLGPAKIFRDGLMFEGRWRRDASTNWQLWLEDNNGQRLPLKPGNTWFDVVALNTRTALTGTTFTANNRVVDTKTECPVAPPETPTPEGFVPPLETPTLMP